MPTWCHPNRLVVISYLILNVAKSRSHAVDFVLGLPLAIRPSRPSHIRSIDSRHLIILCSLNISLLKEYVEYLRGYARHFAVYDRINFNCKVVKVSRAAGGGHDVTYLRRKSRAENWEDGWSFINPSLPEH